MGLLTGPGLSPGSLTILDVVLLVVVLYSCARGFTQGLISELGLLLALLAGTALASRFAAQAGAPLAGLDIAPSWRAAGGYVLILAAVWIGTRFVTGVLRGGARVLMLGWADRLAGAGFGLVRGLLIVALAGFVIVHFQLGALSTVAHDSPLIHAASAVYPTLNRLLPHLLQAGPIVP